jgi:hypothetical protein
LSQLTASELLQLARLGVSPGPQGKVTQAFAKLAEGVEDFIVTGQDLGYVVAKARAEDAILSQYLQRVIRTVAAEEEVPAATDTWRLILGGVGVLVPPGFDFQVDQWANAIEGLESGLASLWSDFAHAIVVMPEASPLDSLCRLRPQEVRSGLLQLFTDKWAEAFNLCEEPPADNWSAFVLPFVVAVDVESSKAFVQGELAPRAPTLAISGIKHRFESNFEDGAGRKTPFLLPPVDWANLFSFVRGMHFRKAVREFAAGHPGARGDWVLKFDPPVLSLTNFKARVAREFLFPEETPDDVRMIAAAPATQLGITYLDSTRA